MSEPGVRSVAIVTDSTCDIPPELADAEGITVIPLIATFPDGTTLVDGELTPEEYFERMRSYSTLPTTSQPPVGDFVSAYARALESAAHVVSIHLSSALSGTIDSARAAALEFGDRVHVVDSRNLHWGLGWQVIEGARTAATGAGFSVVVAAVERCREKVRMIVGLDKLDYLAKGGRIGAVSAFLGGLLDVKVTLTLDADGAFAPVARARGARAAVQGTMEWVREQMGESKRGRFCIGHSMAPDRAEQLRGLVESMFEVTELHVVETGIVISTHTGTGWAVSFVPEG
jgi:DegV family protein with EDD domain